MRGRSGEGVGIGGSGAIRLLERNTAMWSRRLLSISCVFQLLLVTVSVVIFDMTIC